MEHCQVTQILYIFSCCACILSMFQRCFKLGTLMLTAPGDWRCAIHAQVYSISVTQLLVAIGSTLITMGLTVYNHELKQSTGSTRILVWIGISIVLKGPNNANARNIWRLMRASVSGNLCCCANARFLNANAHSCGRECAHLLLARYSALARIRHWANASICYASAPEANRLPKSFQPVRGLYAF